MGFIINTWKRLGEVPKPEELEIKSELTYDEFQEWLSENLPNKFSYPAAMKAVFSSRKKQTFIGKWDQDKFELTLMTDKSNLLPPFAPPLVTGQYFNDSPPLFITMHVGVKHPYWFFKLTKVFLWLFVAAFVFIPFLGMYLADGKPSEIIQIGSFFLLSSPLLAIVLFSVFQFFPLHLARKTQTRTIEILKAEFKAL